MSAAGDGEILRDVEFPFPDGVFPRLLAAVVQKTVLDGLEPARLVVHDDENDWLIGDGVGNPNLDAACVISHIVHVADADPTVAALASLPLGFAATRPDIETAWEIAPHEWAPDI